ncbi:hypothetical protein BU16DRAFT_52366 [Lophium mytilinum]|uniref:Uncharacterized protein n=1 Tax=Lophium mytilinum TaxID=390894 RepID=A0A6A6QMU2_9PEZI|nr:hypothetical protein BU16DRAFT_52366 [Lophium mytilinum]
MLAASFTYPLRPCKTQQASETCVSSSRKPSSLEYFSIDVRSTSRIGKAFAAEHCPPPAYLGTGCVSRAGLPACLPPVSSAGVSPSRDPACHAPPILPHSARPTKQPAPKNSGASDIAFCFHAAQCPYQRQRTLLASGGHPAAEEKLGSCPCCRMTGCASCRVHGWCRRVFCHDGRLRR